MTKPRLYTQDERRIVIDDATKALQRAIYALHRAGVSNYRHGKPTNYQLRKVCDEMGLAVAEISDLLGMMN